MSINNESTVYTQVKVQVENQGTEIEPVTKLSTCLRCNSVYTNKWYKCCPNCGKKLSSLFKTSGGYMTDEESYNKYKELQANKENKPFCFISNGKTYPLCIGEGDITTGLATNCQHCDLYEDRLDEN